MSTASLSSQIKRVASLAVAIAGMSVATVQSAHAQDLTGAGSTFINPIMQQWIEAYQKATGVTINYQSIGSGGGISALTNKTVDFAASDAPMNPNELLNAKAPVVHLPAVIGCVCVAYNVPGLRSGMHMTGPVLADIFLGKIVYWDDPKIAALGNTGLPHNRISVAHRSDGSGTTYIFSDYLSKVSQDWRDTVGTGKSLHWPIGLGGKGSEGVAGLLKTRPNTIGYVELAYATQNDINFCAMRNSKGYYVVPNTDSGSAAADGVKMPTDMRVSITNTPNAKGYPITGFTWVISYVNAAHADPLKKFLTWVLGAGQSSCTSLQYAPVPDSVLKREKAMIDSIH